MRLGNIVSDLSKSFFLVSAVTLRLSREFWRNSMERGLSARSMTVSFFWRDRLGIGRARVESSSSSWEFVEWGMSSPRWLLGLFGLFGQFWLLWVLREAIVSILMQLDTVWCFRACSICFSLPFRIFAPAVFTSASASLMSSSSF